MIDTDPSCSGIPATGSAGRSRSARFVSGREQTAPAARRLPSCGGAPKPQGGVKWGCAPVKLILVDDKTMGATLRAVEELVGRGW